MGPSWRAQRCIQPEHVDQQAVVEFGTRRVLIYLIERQETAVAQSIERSLGSECAAQQ